MTLENRNLDSFEFMIQPGASDGGSPVVGYLLYMDEGITGSPYHLVFNGTNAEIIYQSLVTPGNWY